jgi:23S rRNA pseudouridine1911/1915/1917 synthase
MEKKTIVFCCRKEFHGLRIDYCLSKALAISRSQVELKIKQGLLLINKIIVKKKSICIFEGDTIEILADPDEKKQYNDKDNYNIRIIFEHPDFLIIDKPAGILVHEPKNKTNLTYTLVDFVSSYWSGPIREEFADRKGIVHRLDKETSGIMILARHQEAMDYFLLQFKERRIKKEYVAFTEKNNMIKDFGSITYHIIRDPLCPIKMTYAIGQGKEAKTLYEIIDKKKDFFVLRCFPLSGRTHQIRVHLSAIKIPIIGDVVYGKSSFLINRCALHAAGIDFYYAGTNFSFSSDLHEDMKSLYI